MRQVSFRKLDAGDSTRCLVRAAFSGQVDEPVNVDVGVGGDHLGLVRREAGAEKGAVKQFAGVTEEVLKALRTATPESLPREIVGAGLVQVPSRMVWS